MDPAKVPNQLSLSRVADILDSLPFMSILLEPFRSVVQAVFDRRVKGYDYLALAMCIPLTNV